MKTTLVMIRHGETDWNVERRYMGSTDIALNARGFAQAESLARTLDRDGIAAVYASDRIRALSFARILFPDMPVIADRAFREMDFGVFEGLTHEEILRLHPAEYSRWLDDPVHNAVPGGESYASLRARVLRASGTIAAAHAGRRVAVVTHSGPIRAMLHDRPTKDNFWGIRPDNASVYEVEAIPWGN